MKARNLWRNAAALFVSQFVLCLAVVRFSGIIEPASDAAEYFSIARNLAHGLGFSYDGITPAVYRPPLFSSLLALWFFVTRTDHVLSAMIFQCVVLSAGAVVTYLFFRELFAHERTALTLAFVVVMNPLLFVNVAYVLEEPVLLLVTTMAVWLTVRFLRRGSGGSAVAAGLGWGLATLGKVVTWFAPFLLVAVLCHRRKRDPLSFRRSLVIPVIMLAVVSPWTARNYHRFHQFIPVNAQGTGALEFFVSRGTLSSAGGDVLVQQLQDRHLTPEDRRAALWKFVGDHPALSLAQVGKNVVWFTQPYREWFGKVAGLSMRWFVWVWPGLLFHLPLYAGLFLGGIKAARERRTEALFLFLFYLLYWGEYAIYWGEPRFAMPVFPVLLGLGVEGLRRNVNLLSLRLDSTQ